MARCWIGIGGNVGDVRRTIDAALDDLSGRDLQLVRVSTLYDTTPIGSAAGDRYLNAAAELEVASTPEQLLDELQRLEQAAGRKRGVRWGSRTLDLDVLLYEDQVRLTPRLTLPHPSMWYRRFVLDPLCEIAPQVMHPVFGQTIQVLRERLVTSPLPLSLTGDKALVRHLRVHLDKRFAKQIAWQDAPANAAIALHLAGDPAAAMCDVPQLLLLPQSEDVFTLSGLIVTAALDEPIRVD
ncbi:MAG: 2-amino-4-hydroxy-6-hydroxymethyldihydropteridine diphosphokinase [Planctomycetaceae bacterium]